VTGIIGGVHVQGQRGGWLIKLGNEIIDEKVVELPERGDADGVLESRERGLAGQVSVFGLAAADQFATSARLHDKQPRRLSFTLTCQTVLASWILLSTESVRNTHQLWKTALASIAAHEVPLRPGRIEPRVLKRRREHYPLMHEPREKLREALGKT
jgi:hypothetical protein